MKKINYYNFRGELLTTRQCCEKSNELTGKIISVRAMQSRLKIVSVEEAILWQGEDRKCLCGCGETFHAQSSVTRRSYVEKTHRTAHVQHMINHGCIAPSEWKQCAICNEWFPSQYKELQNRNPGIYCSRECRVAGMGKRPKEGNEEWLRMGDTKLKEEEERLLSLIPDPTPFEQKYCK